MAEELGLGTGLVLAGGMPSFASHAAKNPEPGFIPAAYVQTRVISRPRENRLALDLGCKSIAGRWPISARHEEPLACDERELR
ncbi:MAG: hypothetical protein QM270_10360 [Bacillota bacterium]|nr:hypothetical protein [Bacillota bacterium]